MTTKGKLIVIDGIDGAGKTTQADRLIEHLIQAGLPAERIKFPRYETFTGQSIRRYLRGELGLPLDQSPYLVSLLFAIDRSAARDELIQKLNRGITLVLDRYIPSNACFQAARLPATKRQAFRAWLNELEYHHFKLPRADAFIFLSIPAKKADVLIKQRGEKREAYEKDYKLTQRIAKEYEKLCQTDPTAHKIRCNQGEKLLTIEQIHERIWQELKPIVAPIMEVI